IYEMLAGETPFTGPNPQSVIAKRLTLDAPPLTLSRDIPDSLDHAIRKSLARAPADRWATMEAFGEALRAERATQSNPSFRKQPTTAARSQTASRRKWIVAGALAVVTAAVAVVAFIANSSNANRSAPAPIVVPRDMLLVPADSFRLFGGTC